MKQTYDVNVKSFKPLISPADIKNKLPIPDDAVKTVINGRHDIENILTKKDNRLLVIAGPCSIHDTDAALEYAERMKQLKNRVKEKINIVMRVYFEKPRTTVGWKGLINDPSLDSSYNINKGLEKARSLLIEINRLGMPCATEILDPITPQYIAGLLSWVAIGARTTESQTHREMASGLSMPVGFKNTTGGNLDSAVNAMLAAKSPQHFLGIDPEGYSAMVTTSGNAFGHIVLRGGVHPNYDPLSIRKAMDKLDKKKLNNTILIDCSHDNSGQRHKGQSFVFKSVLDQRIDSNSSIIGMMLESNLFEGNQKFSKTSGKLKYGVSITDECISWDTTEKLILCAFERL
ncbi:MAG: 3-deoxy-7-phosphoheptulonate synthase [Deltaproteobacteria bacterium]|jgi:3-deoxy-7-phosphoheptulonate synthase|nr:3-deoxy-7-phosphoheptulonate synthase [Deltaproteobacteria bacterium]